MERRLGNDRPAGLRQIELSISEASKIEREGKEREGGEERGGV